jgi:2-succinyl-5-enolpyruvyl-6-hydroxy-3-cyclohexene-1-carboxylate synthase
MTPDVSTACARTLVDEWARAGLTDACLAPGSRSAPLALALAADPRIRVHVHLDERSAAFFALGAAKASGRPVLVLCTSGTAVANLHPAVLEARHSSVPLLVGTADRPPELRDTGAPQTTDQVKLFGGDVRFFTDITPDAHPDAITSWRPIAARALAEAAGPPAGPVHLNLAFREPLVPEPGAPEIPEVPGREDGRPWTVSEPGRPMLDPAALDRLVDRMRVTERGLLVAGWGSPDWVHELGTMLHWPLLADPLSGHRGSGGDVTTYEALLRAPGFGESHRPDLVLRFGAPLTSKAVTAWLDPSVPQVLFDPDGMWLDPGRAATERLAALPEPKDLVARLTGGPPDQLGPPGAWCESWLRVEHDARLALDDFLDAFDEPFEGRVARDVASSFLSGRGTLVVASSMPVRDVEAFADRVPNRVLSNRGVNGIDGFTSTVLGVAAVTTDGPVVGLLGDLAFLHDIGGLYGAARRGIDATLVVVDNDGGGIFSFLPQATLPTNEFEDLFGTPHHLDLVAVAAAYGIPALRVTKAGEVEPALRQALEAGGVRVVVVETGDRQLNVVRHREAWAAVAQALESR